LAYFFSALELLDEEVDGFELELIWDPSVLIEGLYICVELTRVFLE
jgi:hypothetical protein